MQQDWIIIPCQLCGSEGRLYHQYAGNPDFDWFEECPCCDGTGFEIIEGEPIELADLDEAA